MGIGRPVTVHEKSAYSAAFRCKLTGKLVTSGGSVGVWNTRKRWKNG